MPVVRALSPLYARERNRHPHMATSEELRPSNRPAPAGRLPVRIVLVAVLAALVGAAFLANGALRRETPQVEFLQQALGEPSRTTPLTRTLPTGERFRIVDRAIVAQADFGSIALQPIGLERGVGWTRTANGVTRTTSFGRRTLLLDGTKAEEFLTVERRQGDRTWSWKLGTKLDPHLRVDGRVELIDRKTNGTFEIAPVKILDADGDDVTPTGLRWSLRGHRLELTLDDRALPLPYVIDPAITVITPNGVHATATATSLSLAKPTGALVSGSTILVAHVSKRNADAVAATGWTSIGQTCNATTVCTALLWKKFAGEAGPYSFFVDERSRRRRRHRRPRERLAARRALARRLLGGRVRHRYDCEPRLADQPVHRPRRNGRRRLRAAAGLHGDPDRQDQRGHRGDHERRGGQPDRRPHRDAERDLRNDLELELDARVGELVRSDRRLHPRRDRRLRHADDLDDRTVRSRHPRQRGTRSRSSHPECGPRRPGLRLRAGCRPADRAPDRSGQRPSHRQRRHRYERDHDHGRPGRGRCGWTTSRSAPTASAASRR